MAIIHSSVEQRRSARGTCSSGPGEGGGVGGDRRREAIRDTHSENVMASAAEEGAKGQLGHLTSPAIVSRHGGAARGPRETRSAEGSVVRCNRMPHVREIAANVLLELQKSWPFFDSPTSSSALGNSFVLHQQGNTVESLFAAFRPGKFICLLLLPALLYSVMLFNSPGPSIAFAMLSQP